MILQMMEQLIQDGDNDKHYFQHKTYKNKNSISFISPENGFKASIEISSALRTLRKLQRIHKTALHRRYT